ncbi:putative tRNA processing endoribonuclease Trz1 [Metarhizium anisopliae]|nr:putative tRNA processing endoribonuclease Trz1 [Metarhizium anisopliae]
MQATQKGPKACTTCAKAKARCIPRADGGEKCERLKKDCFSRPPAPPRVKKRPKRSRVAELEKRLNELSSQFEGAQPASGQSVSAASPPQQFTKASDKTDMYSFEHLFPSPSPTGDDGYEATAWSPEVMKEFDSPWPLPAESEMLLMVYREMFAEYFPFVLIPRELSSADLRLQRPFLWKAVMVSATIFDATRQVKLGEELLADIGKASIVDGTRSLDMLQAVELLIGWWYFALKSSQVTNLLFLARSMCVNLTAMSYGSQGEDAKYGPLDHLRAYAGAYYLNTIIFTTNKKTDVLMSTTQLDHCCKVIENSMEYPSDEYLIKLVKIQQLAQTISITVSSDGMAPMSLPLVMVVQSFQDQLDTFRASLSPRLAQNPTLLCHIHVAEILLKDMAISDQRCSPDNMQVSDRLQLLWSCVKSLSDFFEIRFAEPEIEKPRFLCIIASDLAYTLITGIKLLTLQLPGWDVASITKELDMAVIFGKQIDHLMEIIAKRKSGLLSPDRCGIEDPLERLVRLMRTAQELVGMHINGGSPLQMVDDMGAVAWRDIMNEAPWGMEDSQGLIDLAS